MIRLDRKGKCGEGAYGVVYEAKLTVKKDEETKVQKVAVKRNYGENAVKGVSCVREMNFLASLNHPCIIRLKSISVGDPFEKQKPWTPKPKRHKMKEDSHHFIMEYSEYDLDTFMVKCNNFYQLKTIMCQLLLGMEFIHSKGIIHRDIKPPNVLVSMEGNIPYAKFCDFGLSCVPNRYRPSTPGAVTSWYRSPEIACEYRNYSSPSDIWSLGCVFFEMITKKPFIESKDDDKVIFNDIIKNLPENFTMKELESFVQGGDCIFKVDVQEEKKFSFMSIMKENINVRDFNKKGGLINDFCDLLDKMLTLRPEERLTASQCIDHPFFECLKSYSDDMRKKYPTVNTMDDNINIIDCIERKWAANFILTIYNKKKKIKWFNYDIIFQAMRLFDQYLEYAFSREDVTLRENVTETEGQLNTKKEVEIYIYTCIYIMYKHYSTLYKFYPWTGIFPSHLINDNTLEILEEFERYIIRKITKYVIFKPTFIDLLSLEYTPKSKNENEIELRNFFVNYCRVNKYEGKLSILYKDIKSFISSNI